MPTLVEDVGDGDDQAKDEGEGDSAAPTHAATATMTQLSDLLVSARTLAVDVAAGKWETFVDIAASL